MKPTFLYLDQSIYTDPKNRVKNSKNHWQQTEHRILFKV